MSHLKNKEIKNADLRKQEDEKCILAKKKVILFIFANLRISIKFDLIITEANIKFLTTTNEFLRILSK